MVALPSRRSPLLFLLVASVATVFSACGGTSVKHEPTDEAGTSGQVGTGGTSPGVGGTNAARGGTTGGTGATSGANAGGSGGMTTGAGGSTSGAAGTSGASPVTCDDIRRKTAAELDSIQRCMTQAECGQVLEGTSCGCTHDLVARLDADAGAFYELKDAEIDGRTCNAFASVCDCPNADGFACVQNRCAWNYVNVDPAPLCTVAAIGSMCVMGTPIDAGDVLKPGMPLTLAFRPSGCFSSSCTHVYSSSCAVKAAGNDFYASAEMCLAQDTDPQVGCTDDCGGGGQRTCASEYLLTEGTHTVRYEGEFPMEVTFTVPSVVSDGSLCAAM